MTTPFESRLQRLFVETAAQLPAEDFTARLTAELHESRRRGRLLRSAGAALALGLLWAFLPSLEPAIGTVAAYPGQAFDVVTEALAALSRSPLIYVYGAALAGYAGRAAAQRFHIRLF